MYPAGVRCKSLCESVLEVGFVKEEVNQQVVVVEEMPADEIRSRGDSHVSGAAWNIAPCRKDGLLIRCFAEPYHYVRHVMLNHCHMALGMLACATGAEWDLKADAKKILKFRDGKGRFSLAAVAACPNGKEMAELVSEGLDCEILSYKMDLEQPDAASTISQALHKGTN